MRERRGEIERERDFAPWICYFVLITDQLTIFYTDSHSYFTLYFFNLCAYHFNNKF